mgnify:CR=1 FL=1
MENKIDNSVNYINKFKNIYNKRKKTFLLILVLAIIALIGLNIVNIYKINSNKKIAEKYIQAGLLLASKDNVKAKTLYREIIYSKKLLYHEVDITFTESYENGVPAMVLILGPA